MIARPRHLLVCSVLALALAGALPAFGQQPGLKLQRELSAFPGQPPLSRPSHLALSPSGMRLAAADEALGRVYVFDTDGNVLWTAGAASRLDRPTAVCFDDENTILIAQQNLLVLRISERTPELADTVSDLGRIKEKARLKSIDRLLKVDSSVLILDRSRSTLLRLKPDWSFDKVLVSQGQGKGKLWEPTDVTRDLSGKLIMSDAANLPVQIFSPDGSYLLHSDWNVPSQQVPWEASTVTVTRQNDMWAADMTHRLWRKYDQTGTEISRVPFDPVGLRPRTAASTADNKIIVLDERGTIYLYTPVP